MKKWIMIGTGAVAGIIIVLLVVGLSNLGPMIKNAVNTYGPEITKTEVSLGDVDVSIFSAEAKLKDFYLGNPKGFNSPRAITVGYIYVDMDEGSLTGDTIIIDRIEVVYPEITYEKMRGTDNFQTILKNIKKATDTDKPPKDQSGEKGEGKKILIKNFLIREGKVSLVMPALAGKSVTAPLPDIHLKDLGKKKGGASPGEVFKEVFAALHEKITSPAVTDILNKGLKDLGVGVNKIGKDAKKGLESVADKVKGLFGK